MSSIVSSASGVPEMKPDLPVKSSRAREPDGTDLDSGLKFALDIIHATDLSPQQQLRVMKDSIFNWSEHINPGFLKYRKSVAIGDAFAAIEWRDGTPGGSTVLDATGKVYIDCLGGFGIYNVGHSHPVVMAATLAQLAKQPLHSQELLDPLRGYCARLLSLTMPAPNSGREEDRLRYAFFTNSGTESVEACLKMAMLSTGRRHFIGVVGAFHGKSLGSLSGTSKAAFRRAFGGGLLPFTHVPVNDVTALRTAFESAKFTGSDIAGFLVEPVLGEGGIHVCTDEYLRAARELCDDAGAMLIFDEVQSGMGRTGTMWACEASGIAPDLMAIGKAFGGGVMGAGACVGSEKAWRKYFENPFLHTTTFGGNPAAMAAAIATLHVLRSEGLVDAARTKGAWLAAELRRLQDAHPAIIKQVRGRGLMLGLEFPDDDTGFTFSRGVFARGVLLSGTLVNARTIRVEPPLTITQDELERVIAVFADVLAGMAAGAQDASAGVGGAGAAALNGPAVAGAGAGEDARRSAPKVNLPAPQPFIPYAGAPAAGGRGVKPHSAAMGAAGRIAEPRGAGPVDTTGGTADDTARGVSPDAPGHELDGNTAERSRNNSFESDGTDPDSPRAMAALAAAARAAAGLAGLHAKAKSSGSAGSGSGLGSAAESVQGRSAAGTPGSVSGSDEDA